MILVILIRKWNRRGHLIYKPQHVVLDRLTPMLICFSMRGNDEACHCITTWPTGCNCDGKVQKRTTNPLIIYYLSYECLLHEKANKNKIKKVSKWHIKLIYRSVFEPQQWKNDTMYNYKLVYYVMQAVRDSMTCT